MKYHSHPAKPLNHMGLLCAGLSLRLGLSLGAIVLLWLCVFWALS